MEKELDVHQLANDIKKHASESKNEEELKIRVETMLEPIRKKWGIQWASYEHRHEISGERKDALYGTVIIEYKAPQKLESKSEFEKAKEQVKKYIAEEAKDSKFYGKYFGVILDGFKISFVRFRKNEWEEQEEPIEINAQTVLRLLEAIRGLRRKPIDAELLLLDFGPKSQISKHVILVLYDALIKSKSDRAKMLFDDWKRVFSQVCAYSQEKLAGLADYYDLKYHEKINVEKLLFATHTYYTILMKLLTSEIVTLFADSLLGSYLKRLEEAYYKSKDEMLSELIELEEGGIFATVGIRNFLEADYFAWYLDEWKENIATSIFEIVKKLLEYEPATVELNPERVKDLFKRLYQNLMPRDIRHKLGEYFTPDWLAELLLNETGYDGNPDKRVLDPACGSGTFLVLTIKRIKEYADEHFLDKRELIKKIIDNVRGIDLNPLAVLASKANYLIALAELLRYRPREGIDIPIYLADSISVIRKVTPYGEDEFELNTNEGRFWVTKEVIDKNLLNPVLSAITTGLKISLSKEQFEKSLSKDIPLSEQSIKSFIRLYDKILKLEKYGKNRIWTALLKNSFAPMLIGKFDCVIGNPPWVNWENLPEYYRNSTKHLWAEYGLIGKGAFKKDIAMLFVARCFSLYVNKGGKLAFLVPFTTFKNPSGGGYRVYLANKCDIERIHDLVELYPFEGAINRTAMIVLKAGKSRFPIQCVMWSNPRSGGINMEAELKDVKNTTKQFDMIFTPIKEGEPESPWMVISQKGYNAVQKVLGCSQYIAQEGTNTRGANAIFYVKILDKQHDLFLIKNNREEGKKKYKESKRIVEGNFIFPLIRGSQTKRWYTKSIDYIMLPHDRKTGNVISETQIKTDFQNTFIFLNDFKKELESRKFYGKVIKDKFPFYTLFQVNSNTFSNYKLIWKSIAGKISGKPQFDSAVIDVINDKYLGNKALIPNDSLVFISFDNLEEALYCAAILNSSIMKVIVAAYAIETRIPPNITQNVKIPKFNPKDKLHIRLSKLSKKAHELAQKYEKNDLVAQAELEKVEDEIDKTVSNLYSITNEELEEIRMTLGILKEGKVEEEI